MAQAVEISTAAQDYISELLQQHPGRCLAVRINDKGCGGHKYEWGLLPWDGVDATDEVIDWPGGRLIIHHASLLWMIGSRLELENTPWDTHLSWINPAVTSTCGCGESFALAGQSSCGA